MEFDAIVIGSGMGGLTTASLLSQVYKMKVLVLEKHSRLGGFTHSFSRKGKFHWDVGIHYIGEVNEGSQVRRAYDFVTGGALQWQKFPDPGQYFVYPGLKIAVPAGKAGYADSLKEKFPKEHAAIDQYFKDLACVIRYARGGMILTKFPPPISWIARMFFGRARSLAKTNTHQYFSNLSQDQRLAAVLDSQWGDIGIPMHLSTFLEHAGIAHHYLEGAYYPVGGGKSIAEAIRPLIEKNGGELKTSCEVSSIIIENGRAVGVRSKQGEFRAPVIISNAGARNTYLKLLPSDVKIDFRHELSKAPVGTSVLNLYLGLKQSPNTIGVRGENYWIYGDFDIKKIWEEKSSAFEKMPQFAFVSFGSANDPQAKGPTAQILTFCDAQTVEKWKATSWQKRGEDYKQSKERLTQQLLDFVEPHLPGLKDLVEYAELATPLTVEHFCAHPGGEIYGMHGVPNNYRYSWLKPETPVKGLYLTGADAAGTGVTGALMGGLFAAAKIKGFGVFAKVFRK